MNDLHVSASPHINGGNSVRKIMIDVLIALVPALAAATLFFGYHVIINTVVCLIGCYCSEVAYGAIKKKLRGKDALLNSSASDLSFAVTAVILALNLPSTIQIKGWGLNFFFSNGAIAFSFDTVFACLIGSVFAIIICKMLFGGIGKNFANPACTGRIFLFIAFGSSFAAVGTSIGLDGITGATWLSDKTALSGSLILDMFLGRTGASAVGETSAVAILIGFVYLSVKKVIDFRTPLILIGAFAVFIFFFDVLPTGGTASEMGLRLCAQILSGGLIFGSVFMATDYATSPNTFKGNIIFAVGIALFTALIRAFGSLPEGFSFALLIMNIVTPLIDKYVLPRPFGYVKERKSKNKPTRESANTVAQKPAEKPEQNAKPIDENRTVKLIPDTVSVCEKGEGKV